MSFFETSRTFKSNLFKPVHIPGPRIVEKYMEKACSINMIPDIANVPNLDAWLRASALTQQVPK